MNQPYDPNQQWGQQPDAQQPQTGSQQSWGQSNSGSQGYEQPQSGSQQSWGQPNSGSQQSWGQPSSGPQGYEQPQSGSQQSWGQPNSGSQGYEQPQSGSQQSWGQPGQSAGPEQYGQAQQYGQSANYDQQQYAQPSSPQGQQYGQSANYDPQQYAQYAGHDQQAPTYGAPAGAQPWGAEPKKPGNGKMWAIIGGAVALLAAIGVVLWLVLSGGGRSAKDAAEAWFKAADEGDVSAAQDVSCPSMAEAIQADSGGNDGAGLQDMSYTISNVEEDGDKATALAKFERDGQEVEIDVELEKNGDGDFEVCDLKINGQSYKDSAG